MNVTNIEWTDFSANPLKYRDAEGNIVWACIHASPGCMKCYSEQLGKRYGRGGPFNVAAMEGLTPFMDEKELHHMLTAKTIQGKPVAGGKCFVGDMTDIFGEWVPFGLIDQLFTAFAKRRDVTWQILTKRADRMHQYFAYPRTRVHDAVPYSIKWPLPNVWLGVSVENQQWADTRIPLLLEAPAAVHFASYEPALGNVDFMPWLDPCGRTDTHTCANGSHLPYKLDWIIYGGESGPGARPNEAAWARAVRDQCQAAGVPFFFKQWGGVNKKAAGRLLDGREWNEYPRSQ